MFLFSKTTFYNQADYKYQNTYVCQQLGQNGLVFGWRWPIKNHVHFKNGQK